MKKIIRVLWYGITEGACLRLSQGSEEDFLRTLYLGTLRSTETGFVRGEFPKVGSMCKGSEAFDLFKEQREINFFLV